MEKNLVGPNNRISHLSLTTQVYFLTFIGFFLSALMGCLGSVIDGLIIGHTMSTADISASSVTAPIWFLAAMTASLLAKGTQQLCSEKLGAGKLEEARDIYSVSVIMGFIVNIVFSFILVAFSGVIVKGLGVDPGNAAYKPCVDYLIGIAFCFPASSIMNQVSTMLHFEGARSWTVFSVLIMSFTNIVFDLVAVFVLHGGIFAMGLATTLSYYVSAGFLLLYYRRDDVMLKPRLARTPLFPLFEAAYNGLPNAVSRLTTAGRTAMINAFLATSLSAAGLAAFNVQVQLNYIANAAVFGIAQTMGMICGIYFVEHNKRELRKTFIMAFATHLVLGVVVFILCRNELVAGMILNLYLGPNKDAFYITSLMLEIFGWVTIGQGVAVLMANYLQSIKKIIMANVIYVLDDLVLTYIFMKYVRFYAAESGQDYVIVGSTFIGLAMAQIVMVLLIPMIVLIVNKRFGFGWNWVLMLPKDYGIAPEDELFAAPKNIEEAIAFSQDTKEFCNRHSITSRTSNAISVAVEELITNTIEHGFKKGKRNRVEARLAIKDGSLILSLRDNCVQFNPLKQYQIALEDEDRTSNLGIRMVMGLVEDVTYTSSLKLNNITLKIPIETQVPEN